MEAQLSYALSFMAQGAHSHEPGLDGMQDVMTVTPIWQGQGTQPKKPNPVLTFSMPCRTRSWRTTPRQTSRWR